MHPRRFSSWSRGLDGTSAEVAAHWFSISIRRGRRSLAHWCNDVDDMTFSAKGIRADTRGGGEGTRAAALRIAIAQSEPSACAGSAGISHSQ